MTPRRLFLGWDRPLLAAAAKHLLADFGEALADQLIVVPGQRAERRLLELLAADLPGGRPPRIVTAGAAVDELLAARGRGARRLPRTLAWAQALRSLPRELLAALLALPPERDDLPAWRELGVLLRRLHGELAAGDHDFASAAGPAARVGGPGEARRWATLDEVRRRYLALLAAQGLVDPHEARREALREGSVRRDARVVLIGVVEASGLLRAALGSLASSPLALIFAPETEASRFDELGCVRAPAAGDAALPHVPLDVARWFVEDRPEDQADRVVALLADPVRRRPASEITVGLLDPEVGPPLTRRLQRDGVAVHDGAGTPVSRTAPVALLAATAAWLDGRSMDAFAALVRQPDLGLAAARAGLLPALDSYRAEHLPASTRGPWLAREGPAADVAAEGVSDGATGEASPGTGSRRARREVRELAASRTRRRILSEASRALEAQLGDLAGGRPRALAEWVPALRAWLTTVYGEHEFRPAVRAAEHLTAEALALLGQALDELAEARAWTAPVSAAVALGELAAALSGATLPPMPSSDAVELLGWLELPLDDAPLLVLTGVNEGRLPEAVAADAFLPDALAAALGLTHDGARCQRDALLLETLRASRDEVLLVSGRRGREGDPLRPSRLLFACPSDQLMPRLQHWLAAGRRRPRAPAAPPPPAPRSLPMAPAAAAPTRLSVTAFRAFLQSPYRFYLERVLHLRGVDDRALELDPLAFGTLAHEVLAGLPKLGAAEQQSAQAVEALLLARLEALAAARFGRTRLPALTLQLGQLRARLVAFAARQAAWASEGWRVAHAEWEPAAPVLLDVDGEAIELTGSIDRIDHNDRDGRWAILDYKTSEKAAPPHGTHRRNGRWIDLQLPLYRVLAGELALPSDLALGYVNLPADLGEGGFSLASTVAVPRSRAEPWDEALLASALSCAADVVRAVRRGRFDELGDVTRRPDDEPVLAALAGLGLLDVPPPAPEDDDEDEDGDTGSSAP